MHKQMIFATVLFLVGSASHTYWQIDAIARAKNNPNNSRLGILRDRWATIMNRAFWSLAIFALWLQGQLAAVLGAMHISLPAAVTGILGLHISGAITFMAGYMSDSALAFIPGLTTSIPPAIQNGTFSNGPSGPKPTVTQPTPQP
jgi:hypothetical protein